MNGYTTYHPTLTGQAAAVGGLLRDGVLLPWRLGDRRCVVTSSLFIVGLYIGEDGRSSYIYLHTTQRLMKENEEEM